MSQNLDILQAYNDPDTRIRILLGGDVVHGCVISDTNLQVSVQWNDPMQQLAEQAKNWLQSQLGGVGAFLAGAVRKISPVQAQPLSTTVKQWVSTGGPSLPLNLIFLAVNPGDDVRTPVNKIMKYAWPTASGGMMYPPGGYKNVALVGGGAIGDPILDGVITVEIGRWFSAKQIMIISGDPTPTYSKEVMADTGRPLWAAMSVTFAPYRAITYDDWMSFFP